SVYNENRSIWTDMGSPRGWKGMGNMGTGSNLNDTRGTVFTIPYCYAPMPASEVVSALTPDDCGAGNTGTCAYGRPWNVGACLVMSRAPRNHSFAWYAAELSTRSHDGRHSLSTTIHPSSFHSSPDPPPSRREYFRLCTGRRHS